jgi:tetratricopeptide (TPR) repeat protein
LSFLSPKRAIRHQQKINSKGGMVMRISNKNGFKIQMIFVLGLLLLLAELSYCQAAITFDTSLPESERGIYIQLRQRATNLDMLGLNAQLGLAKLYKKYDKKEASKREANRVLSMADQIIQNPKNEDILGHAYIYKARTYDLIFQQRIKSIQVLDEYFQKYPTNKQFYNAKNTLIDLLITQADYNRALKESDILIKDYPKCRMDTKTYAEYKSMRAIGSMVDLESQGQETGYKKKGLIYEKMGDKKAALENYQKAISILSSDSKTKGWGENFRDSELKAIQDNMAKLSTPGKS